MTGFLIAFFRQFNGIFAAANTNSIRQNVTRFRKRITFISNINIFMAKQQPSYKEAMEQLEKLIAEIESNSLDIDELSEKITVATRLISLCKEKLYQTEKEVQKIISENG